MCDLVHRLNAAGIACWIISATNRWTVEVYAEMFLAIPAERVLGITPRIRGGRIQGEADPAFPVTVGAGKVAAIDSGIGRRPIFAAGDSTGDWEMLETATDLCLVIDHGDVEMGRRIVARRQAGERRWVMQPRFIDPPQPAYVSFGE
jgi:phosphoserine phosphatase